MSEWLLSLSWACVCALDSFGFGFLFNVLFVCILTALGFVADSRYREPNLWEAFAVKQLQKVCLNKNKSSSGSLGDNSTRRAGLLSVTSACN